MAERPLNPDPLNPEEAVLWRRVVATVRPVAGRVLTMSPARMREGAGQQAPLVRPAQRVDQTERPPPLPPASGQGGLDASWDRSLAKGAVAPDRIVDLHGDTLDRAYGRIDTALAQATAAGERVLLLVTGKPGGTRAGRGAIRAIVGDWLAASRHAGRIAAVRPAHPRHGGAGALYVVLRRNSARR